MGFLGRSQHLAPAQRQSPSTCCRCCQCKLKWPLRVVLLLACMQVQARSDSMDAFCQLFGVPRWLRQATRLMTGVHISVSGDELVIKQVRVGITHHEHSTHQQPQFLSHQQPCLWSVCVKTLDVSDLGPKLSKILPANCTPPTHPSRAPAQQCG